MDIQANSDFINKDIIDYRRLIMAEDTWTIPTEAHVTPVPLIGFVGLQTENDADSDHRRLW